MIWARMSETHILNREYRKYRLRTTEINKAEVNGTNENIRVQVIRSGRKSLGLEVRPDGTVLARIPARLSDRKLKAFIEKQQDWILKKVDQVKKRADARTKIKVPSVDALSDAEIQKIKDKIADRVKYYCAVMQVTVGRITIRNQKTRWGSCSSAGNVNFG